MGTIITEFLTKRDELRAAVNELSSRGTELGDIFSRIKAIWEEHMKKENDTITPLLTFLDQRLKGVGHKNFSDQLIIDRDNFSHIYATMSQEHKIIKDLCRKALDILKTEPDVKASYAAEQMISMFNVEEEFVYPIGLAYGDILRMNKVTDALDAANFFVRIRPQ